MIGSLRGWLNSIHAHMLGLALGVIAALTLVSNVIISYTEPALKASLTIYEISRIAGGLPLARREPETIVRSVQRDPQGNDERTEKLIASLLAAQLDVPVESIRVHLNEGDRARWQTIRNEIDLYRENANPQISGTFMIAVQRSDGRWNTATRIARNPLLVYLAQSAISSIYIGMILIIPISMWFSARLTRPVRAFAASANRLSLQEPEAMVPVQGPTEIRIAAVALNDMQARVRRFIRERASVIGAIAHDLRTPLNSLRFRAASAPQSIRDAMESDIKHMDQIISSTLAYVEAEARPSQMDCLDLSMLVESLVDDYRDRGENVRLEAADPITIIGDVALLKRLITNLVDNGLKFGTQACVSVRQKESSARIDICDNGPGMAEQELAQAFEPFFRSERSRGRATGGTGLGLTIALSAARIHGGTIELTNITSGLRARVSFPLCQGDRANRHCPG